jgi:hypothetical protein
MIQHQGMPDAPHGPEAFVFASLAPSTCSICAPLHWTKERVELFACADMQGDGWTSVDSKELFGQKDHLNPTPHPCTEAPSKGMLYFLVRNP